MALAAVRFKTVVLLLLIHCCSHCLWVLDGTGFVVQYLVFFLVLQSSYLGRESYLLCFNCLFDVMWLFVFCDGSSRYHGLVCSLCVTFPGHIHFFQVPWLVGLILYVSVNSYGHVETVSSPNHTFSWACVTKRLASTLCTYICLNLTTTLLESVEGGE